MVKTQYYNYSFHSKGIRLSALVVYNMRFYYIKMPDFLHMSEKSSTFAVAKVY